MCALLAVAAGLCASATARAATIDAAWSGPVGTVAPATPLGYTLTLDASAATGSVTFAVDAAPFGELATLSGPVRASVRGVTCTQTATVATCAGRLPGSPVDVTVPISSPLGYAAAYAPVVTGTDTAGDQFATGALAADPVTVSAGGPSTLDVRSGGVDDTNDHVTPGSTVRLPFEITNRGTGSAEHVVIDVTAGDGLVVAGVGTGTPIAGIGTATARIDLGAIALGATRLVAVTVQGTAVTPEAAVTVALVSKGDDAPDGSTEATTTVQVSDGTTAELRINPSDFPTWLPGAGPLTHVYAVTNVGPDPFRMDGPMVVSSDGVTISAVSVSTGARCLAVPAGAGTWTCDLGGSLAVGTDLRISVTGTAASGPRVVTTTVRMAARSYVPMWNGGRFASTIGTVIDPQNADLDIFTQSAVTGVVGRPTPVTFVVRNNGPGVAGGVSVDGRLVSDAEWVDADIATCTGGPYFRCDLGVLGPGDEAVFTVRVRGTRLGGFAFYRASVAAMSGVDAMPDNNDILGGFDIVEELPEQVRAIVRHTGQIGRGRALRHGITSLVAADRRATAIVRLYLRPATARRFGIRSRMPVLVGTGVAPVGPDRLRRLTATVGFPWRVKLGRMMAGPVTVRQQITVRAPGSTSVVVTRNVRIVPD